MDEYIERGAVIKEIANVKMSDVVPNWYEPAIKEALCKQGQAIKKIIKDQPTADVVEVRHGKWKYNWGQAYGEPLFFCSLCVDGGSNNGHDNYCPNCGADMRGNKNGKV